MPKALSERDTLDILVLHQDLSGASSKDWIRVKRENLPHSLIQSYLPPKVPPKTTSHTKEHLTRLNSEFQTREIPISIEGVLAGPSGQQEASLNLRQVPNHLFPTALGSEQHMS